MSSIYTIQFSSWLKQYFLYVFYLYHQNDKDTNGGDGSVKRVFRKMRDVRMKVCFIYEESSSIYTHKLHRHTIYFT